MSCEVSNTSFYDAVLESNWPKDDDGLDAIAKFNASFDQPHCDTINPQMTFSNPATPQQNNDAFDFTTISNTNAFDPTLSLDSTQYEAYPLFNTKPPSSPYFQQSIESAPYTLYSPSPPRTEQPSHRRSVSEPPADITFHRERHYLGPPMRQPKISQLKSLPGSKSRAQRSHPYPTRSNTSASFRGQNLAHSHSSHGQMERPGSHRSQTQPTRMHHPTSAPMTMPLQSFDHPRHHQRRAIFDQQNHSPLAPSISVPTSRVCTPAPEGIIRSPSVIDPALGQGQSQLCTPRGSEKRQQTTVQISVSVGELREMIIEAVQQAVGTRLANVKEENDEGDNAQLDGGRAGGMIVQVENVLAQDSNGETRIG